MTAHHPIACNQRFHPTSCAAGHLLSSESSVAFTASPSSQTTNITAHCTGIMHAMIACISSKPSLGL